MNDAIYALCFSSLWKSIRAYEDSVPRDLLMITMTEEINDPGEMVGVNDTNNIYVRDRNKTCIWKIDTVNNKVDEWLSELSNDVHLSVANDNRLLLLKDVDDLLHLEIYDENARLVKRLSLPNEFKGPFYTMQKPNGEFIVSHYFKKSYGMSVSFLSADGQIISQLRLNETIGFKLKNWMVQYVGVSPVYDFASEKLNGNVYFYDLQTFKWKRTDCSVTNAAMQKNSINGREVLRSRCSKQK